jgi:hypothetical protein
MRIHFNSKEVDDLAKGLRKIRRKNRYLLSTKDSKCLKKASQALSCSEDLERRKPHFLKKWFFNFIKFILKLFV